MPGDQTAMITLARAGPGGLHDGGAQNALDAVRGQ